MECVSRESATVLECMLETAFPVEVRNIKKLQSWYTVFWTGNDRILLLVYLCIAFLVFQYSYIVTQSNFNFNFAKDLWKHIFTNISVYVWSILTYSILTHTHLIILSEAKPCPSNQKCPDSHTLCYIDPLFPVKAICRCDIREGFKRSKDGTRCIGECNIQCAFC